MKKILWIDDGEIKNHPIANQLLNSLISDNYEIILATADKQSGKESFRPHRGDEFTRRYVERKRLRKKIFEKIVSNSLIAETKLEKVIHILESRANHLDKSITRIAGYKIEKGRIRIRALPIILKLFKKSDYILISRGYLFTYVLIAQCLHIFRHKPKIIYYPFELYGEQYAVKVIPLFRLIETLYTRCCIHLLITQNELRANYYRSKGYKGNLLILRNYKVYEGNVEKYYVNKIVEREKTLKLIFLGLVNKGRHVDEILRWMLQEEIDCTLTIIGKIEKAWRIEQKLLVEKLIKEDKLTILESKSMHELKTQFVKFDAGLIIYDDSCKNHLYCAPSKLTDYLHGGLPIISSSLPAMKLYSEMFSFVQLYESKDAKSFRMALENIQKWRSKDLRLSISYVSKEMNWKNEYEKLKNQLRVL